MLVLPSNIYIAAYVVIPGPGHVPRDWGTRCLIDVEVWIVYFSDERIFWCSTWASLMFTVRKLWLHGRSRLADMCINLHTVYKCHRHSLSLVHRLIFDNYRIITWNHVCLFYMHYIINNVHVNIPWIHCLTSHHLFYCLLFYKYSYLS